MKKPEIITAEQAVDSIKNRSTVCTIGMTLVSAAETVLSEIERRFLEEGTPNSLTLLHSCGQFDQERGTQHFAHEGLIKRVIGGHWGLSPKMMNLISEDKIEAYCLPQGQMANMYHSMALREPGKISKIGIGTFVDPRLEGGKMNPCTKKLEDIVEVIEIHGEEYLLYKEQPIDTLIIRGTFADEVGNISTSHEAMSLEVLPAVMATKRFGGKVICQVERIVKKGSISPKEVTVPGVLVDMIVVCDDPQNNHKQTHSWYYDPSYSGQGLAPEGDILPVPLNFRKVIGRRAMMELQPDIVLNVGTGIPNDVIGSILAEENLMDDVTLTVESGIYGGIPSGGLDFGISKNAQAIIGHDRQFEYYNGAGIDYTFMGAGELDGEGNVNATKMGSKAPGAGGFIDITSMAKNVIFCSTFTGVGLKGTCSKEKGVIITNEGSVKKLVKKVQQVSFPGKYAASKGQNVFFVTERAVFQVTTDGVVLKEVAKGIDLEKDVLAQMDFKPIISPNLKEINSEIYRDGAFGLKEIIRNK